MTDNAEALAQLTEFIHTEEFSCLGARAALKRDAITHQHYASLGDENSAQANYRDLLKYAQELPEALSAKSFRTFVATFDGPGGVLDECEFEGLIWRHLQVMHDIDCLEHGLFPGASSDPREPNFGFHAGSHPFFVVGLHPGSSRASRRFGRPAVAFNSNVQFALLGEKFFSMQDAIRKREMENNGSVNPSFAHYEYRQPARHFSGRFTTADWECPYVSRHEPSPLKFTEDVLRRPEG